MGEVLASVLPVFALVALGVLLARRMRLDRPTLSHLAIDIGGPCLVFSLLSRSQLSAGEGLRLIGGTAFTVLFTSLLVLLYARGRVHAHRGLFLVVGYWNSGNLALSCSRLAFGETGAQAAAVVFCTTMALHATLGLWIAHGELHPGRLLRTPLFHAALLGVMVAALDIEVPRMLAEPIAMLGQITIPLLLLTLGIQLDALRIDDLRRGALAVLLRMLGGLFAMGLFVKLFQVTGVAAKVLLLNGVMPAAVINVALAERYDIDRPLVASATVLGTLVSLAVIPVMLWLLLRW